MINLVAFSEIHQNAGSEDAIAGVPDQTSRVNGDDIYIGKFNQIVAAFAYGHSIGNARLTSPSLRALADLYITPLVNDMGGYAQYTTRVVDDRKENPLMLAEGEALNAYITDTQIAADKNDLVGVWLADGAVTPVTGEIITIYAEATAIAGLEKKWVNAEMVWTPDLPVGRYQLVGARCYLGGGGLFRFSFIGEANRMGGICVHDKHLQEDEVFRLGRFGVWGEFDSATPPSLDILPILTAGSTGAYLRLDLIKVG